METMKPVHWIILVVALIAAICLLLFVRGRVTVTMKNLAADTGGVKTNESTTSWWPSPADKYLRYRAPGCQGAQTTSWWPSPADKYLPAWVIISMSLAVWVLASQVNSVVGEICQVPGRCATAASAASSSTAEKAAAAASSSAASAASAASASVSAAAAAAAASAVLAAPGPKPK